MRNARGLSVPVLGIKPTELWAGCLRARRAR